MFSLATGCISSQIPAPISFAVQQLSLLKHSQIRPAIQKQQRDHSTLNAQSVSQSAKEIAKFLGLNQNAIEKLPKVVSDSVFYQPAWSRQNVQQVRNFSQSLSSRTKWNESHTSYNTFAENKQGYPSSYSMLHSVLSKYKLTSPTHTAIRGFKTRQTRQTTRESVWNKLAQLPKRHKKASDDRLSALLAAEPNEETRKNLKIAFAEGYTHRDGKSGSKWQKHMYSIHFLITVALNLGLIYMLSVNYLRHTDDGSVAEVVPEDIHVNFKDVCGANEAKAELQEIVNFLKDPEKYTALGAQLPKGALLVGPPGTGKTLLARAIAGEAGVPFFNAPAPEFDEIFVGQGAKRIRDLFAAAKAKAPCVIFIDEIDSVGSQRSSSAVHPHANQTINQFLAELDGFVQNDGIIVLGATNRRDTLDKALLRPGRFDVEVHVPVPDQKERTDLFQHYLSKVKYGPDVEVEILSRRARGLTGADIKNIVNQAALKAASNNETLVTMHQLEEAQDRAIMGTKSQSRIPDEQTNTVTAFHEGGHAIVGHFTKGADLLHKVTIMPRGSSLGHTSHIPAKEEYNSTREQLLAKIDVCMGGRAAEELTFGADALTTGASSDLNMATRLATYMVKSVGMSERVGLQTFSPGQDTSVSTKEAIDEEINKILQESYMRAKKILIKHSKELQNISEALLKYETLDADDVQTIIDGKSFSKSLS